MWHYGSSWHALFCYVQSNNIRIGNSFYLEHYLSFASPLLWLTAHHVKNPLLDIFSNNFSGPNKPSLYAQICTLWWKHILCRSLLFKRIMQLSCPIHFLLLGMFYWWKIDQTFWKQLIFWNVSLLVGPQVM